jgi:threonine synthase
MTLIETYSRFLPVSDATPIVSLGEGNTPLIPADRLREQIGLKPTLYLKYEGMQPTGSFKDRGMTVAVSKALEAGAQGVMCASTGNTSASAAAYAAKAGLRCVVLIPEGKIALGKLSQACTHGAKVLSVKGNFDECLPIVRELTARGGMTLVNSVNPHRLQGQKTAAFEICDTLGRAPDFHAIPVGNAGNISAYWMGFTEYLEESLIESRPRMLGFQAAGAAPLVQGSPVARPETIATAIRIGNPASWDKACAAVRESGGLFESVTDGEILQAYDILARCEGVFCEPASAASVAGVIKLAKGGFFDDAADKTITCTLTGHGLKDPDTAIAQAEEPLEVEASADAVREAIAGRRAAEVLG